MADAKNFVHDPAGTDSESEVYTTTMYQSPVQAQDTATTLRPPDHVSRQLPPTSLVGSSLDCEGDKGNYPIPIQEEGDLKATAAVFANHNPLPVTNLPRNGNAHKSSRKVCSVLTVITIVVVTAGALVAGGLLAVFQQPTDFDVAIYLGDTIILDRRKITWYSEVTITELSTPEDDHEVDVFIEQCTTLQNFVHTRTVAKRSPDLSVDEAVVTILENTYLLSSSNVSLIILIWDAHHRNSTMPKLCVFDDKTSFDRFISGDYTAEKNAIECFPTNISTSSAQAYTRIDYIFPESSYYYIGINFGSTVPLTLQYNYTLWERSYNHSDFAPPYCSVTTVIECRIPFELANSLHGAEECLLAYTELPGFAENEYVNLHKNLKRRILNAVSISLLVLAVIISIVGILLLFWLVKKLYCKKHTCRNNQYSPVPSDTE